MAAVSISPSTHPPLNMSNRRAPLSNISNAGGSPYRTATAAATAASKRARPSHVTSHDVELAQPPSKKAMLSKDQGDLYSPSTLQVHLNPDARVFNTRRTRSSQYTTLTQRLRDAALSTQKNKTRTVSIEKTNNSISNQQRPEETVYPPGKPHRAVADRPYPSQRSRDRIEISTVDTQHKTRSTTERVTNEKMENVRLWQKHYRKAFPTFIFYFDNVPHDVRFKCLKQLDLLGAKHVKFFSKDVTHVVATHPISSEEEVTSSTDPKVAASLAQRNPLRTIDPSLLQRASRSAPLLTQDGSVQTHGSYDGNDTLTAITNVPPMPNTFQMEATQFVTSFDIITRAKERGIKIWALEKFQRMMTVLFDTETDPQNYTTMTTVTSRLTRSNHEPQLSRLLRNERRNGPADRDRTVVTQELITFKGPFIYVHDMDEKARPIMVREYPKVEMREDGKWPQFRSVHEGRCPFVAEIDDSKRFEKRRKALEELDPEQTLVHERERQKERTGVDEDSVASRTRAALAHERAKMQPPPRTAGRGNALPSKDHVREQIIEQQKQQQQQQQQQGFDERRTSPVEVSGQASMTTIQEEGSEKTICPPLPRALQGHVLVGGEPVASGLEASNVTSAIRSQMISSTAAGPGAKTATNKEVYSLKRKILEKNGATPLNPLAQPFKATNQHSTLVDMETATGGVPTTTKTMVKGHQVTQRSNVAIVQAAGDEQAGEQTKFKKPPTNTIPAAENQRPLPPETKTGKTKMEKEAKAGYCENCRDKFDDFDEHVQTSAHRRFATNSKNWTQLDALLCKLRRYESAEW